MCNFIDKEYENVNLTAVYGWLNKAFEKNLWEGKCYQYTQLHVVDSFLSEGNLRATSVGFLNDTAEYMFGGSALKDDETLPLVATRFFSCSFSKKADNIQQYMMYAGEIGVAVEFDFSFQSWFKKTDSIPSLSVADMGDNIISLGQVYRPIEIEYVEEKEIRQKIKDEIEKVNKMPYDDKVFEDIVHSFIPCYMKKKGFKPESELRFAVPNYQLIFDIAQSDSKNEYATDISHYRDWKNLPSKVEFVKASNKLLKPYINLFYSIKVNKKSNKTGLPISSIWIGPGRDQLRAFNSIKMRLECGEIRMFPLPVQQYVRRLKLFAIFCLGWLYCKYSDTFANIEWSEASVTDEVNLQESKDNNIFEFEQRLLDKFGPHFKNLDDYISDVSYKDKIIGSHDNALSDGSVALAKKLYSMSYRILLKIVAEQYKSYFESKVKPEMFINVDKYPKLKLNEKWCSQQAEKFMLDFNKYNYFSSIGIAVHCSMKDLSLT